MNENRWFWFWIEFLITCLPLYSIEFCFYSFNLNLLLKVQPWFLLLKVKGELSDLGVVRILDSKLKSWESKSPLKTQTHPINIYPKWSSNVNFQDRKHSSLVWESSKCAISRYSLLTLSFTLYLGLVFIRLDFSFFFGVIIWGLLVVLWPCRAKGHVEPDHPFSMCFCVFLNVFVVNWNN